MKRPKQRIKGCVICLKPIGIRVNDLEVIKKILCTCSECEKYLLKPAS